MYLVGNGKNLSIRADKWTTSGPIGGPATKNEPEHVAALIEPGNSKWNTQPVELMFDDRIAKEILATPIGGPDSTDKLVWMHSKSGIYSAKSGYHTVRKHPASIGQIATSSHHINPDLETNLASKNPPKNQFFFSGKLLIMLFLHGKTYIEERSYRIPSAPSVAKRLKPLNIFFYSVHGQP